jgi:hypothetical protein
MSPAEVALLAATVLVGLLAGNELGTLAVIHPALDRLGHPAGVQPAQAVIAAYGRVMPVVMPVTIAVTAGAAALLDSGPRRAALVAVGLLVAMLVVTFAGLMPLNRAQLEARASTPAQRWAGWRSRWRRLHAVRVVLDVAALVAVAWANVVH